MQFAGYRSRKIIIRVRRNKGKSGRKEKKREEENIARNTVRQAQYRHGQWVGAYQLPSVKLTRELSRGEQTYRKELI